MSFEKLKPQGLFSEFYGNSSLQTLTYAGATEHRFQLTSDGAELVKDIFDADRQKIRHNT